MNRYKYKWKSFEELKQEEWELKVLHFSTQEGLKDYLASQALHLKNVMVDDATLLNVVDEVNRYGNLIKRLKEELEDIRKEIKEREDEENQITADNL